MRTVVENCCQRVDFAQEVLRRRSGPRRAARAACWRWRPPTHRCSTSWRKHPRNQRGVARVVQLELVDAQHACNRPADRCIRRSRTPRPAGSAPRRSQTPWEWARIVGQLTIGEASRWVLPTPNPPSRYSPTPGQRRAFAEQLSAARPALDGLLAELLARRDGGGLSRLGRVGAIAREAHVGESRRRRQLGDQPFR